MSKKISKNGPVLEVPREIRELAQEFCRQRVEQEQAKRREKQEMEAEQKRVRAARLKTGLKYATKVFLWAKALKESSLGQELMRKSHTPTAYSSIILFDGRIVGMEWIGLGISMRGMFLTGGGRYSALTKKMVTSSKNLAESVPTVTLKVINEWIDTGEVWDCIKRRFDYLKK